MSVRLLAALLWLIHWIPFRVMGWIAQPIGLLLYHLLSRRRKIGAVNLRLCLPHLSEPERARLLRQHFCQSAHVMLGYSILYWGSPRRLEKLVRVEGAEHLAQAAGKPVILLSPHFLGLDFGGVRFSMEHHGSAYLASQRGAFNEISYRLRNRFHQPLLVKRSEGIRPIVKALKQGVAFYYLPDQDLGPKDSIFVPFFGVATATTPALPRIAKISHAQVIPMVTTLYADHLVVRYEAAWQHYPSEDVTADTLRMNQFIEQRVLDHPSQYFWLHRRFKTRPEGEASVY
ncbi:lipid A biosynthesis acyltransferase [Chitinibacter fontanus]|uniref:Lipid A biosynthesis acyltransferase n=1 Tax=Chitinibacter fontanus TaxID=1737446 RepID=A0A7D5V967_9NEIS|nr:lipid A biosynthesis acyltransferase [Chitinibacter fontanus]QLI81235.1 lipid A biosynthesis acyltransferase [Chitinibacter fontanus]